MTTSSNRLVDSMQMSNKFTADLVPTSDKHKHKSVERLTQDFFSTAATKVENSRNQGR